MDLQLAGKTALVTAASSGLGKASARQFALEGSNVVMCSRSEAIYGAAAEILKESGSKVIGLQADVTLQQDIEKLVQHVIDQFGRIDIMVINAGGPTPGSFLDLTISDWEEAVQLTLMSAVRLCYAVVPQMLNQGSGSIVAIESISVRQPIENLILSNSIRMAVIGMLKSMANELGPVGIRINSINPTFTHTERVEQLLARRAEKNSTSPDEEADAITATIPLRRMGTVEEFGRAVAWLASPAASYVHG
ncbi:MAG: SDR family oxidoreductase, partial [Candidatus Promineifilaceae bacterium]